jgi:hypothetical protein
MADGGGTKDQELKVFISYSCKDEGFAQELLAGLQHVGFERYLDRHDIATRSFQQTRASRTNRAIEFQARGEDRVPRD